MKLSIRTVLLALLPVFVLPLASFQVVAPEAQASETQASETLAPETLAPETLATEATTPQERWRAKSPEERALLRQRFEKLSRLEPNLQEDLRQRAHELTGALRSLENAPPPWVRERLAKTAPDERGRELQRCLKEHRRRRGSDLRSRLPKEILDRLEQASNDADRAQIVQEFFQEHRSRMFPRIVARMGRHLDLEAAEIELLQGTELTQQSAVLDSLKRRMIITRGRPEGPDGIEATDWDAWQALPDREFLERIEFSGAFQRGQRPGQGGPPFGPRRGPRGSSERDANQEPRGPRGEGHQRDGQSQEEPQEKPQEKPLDKPRRPEQREDPHTTDGLQL